MEVNTYELVLNEETKHTNLRVKESFTYKDEKVNTPERINDMMRELFHLEQFADEYMYLIAFNIKMKVLGIFEISHGIGNASLVDARGVFMRALQIGANSIILVHNHPSGETTPSRPDIKVCNRMMKAGELLEIELLDFMIIGTNFFSFKENKMLEKT